MKRFFFLIAFLFICSCSASSQSYVEIIKVALNTPEIKKYFHPNLKSRNPYYLLENEYADKSNKLSIHGIPVITTGKANIKNENYIKITRFIKKNSGVEISYYYKIENIEVSTQLKKINGEWMVTSHKVFQF